MAQARFDYRSAQPMHGGGALTHSKKARGIATYQSGLMRVKEIPTTLAKFSPKGAPS
jgi:hypothetical protein